MLSSVIKYRVGWTWFGGGLTLSGAALTGWAYVLWHSAARDADPPGLMTVLFIGAALLFIGLVVAQVQVVVTTAELARAEGPAVDKAKWMVNQAAVIVRRRAWICAAAMAILAFGGGQRAFAAIGSGFPEFRDFAFVVGATITLIGLTLHASGTPDHGSAAGKVVMAGAGMGTAAAVMALTYVAATMPLWTEATTANEAARPAAVPETVGKVAWRWKPPEGVREPDVVPAGGGVVVQVPDGVVALDTTTGRERWHYRRPGARAYDVKASPDGRTVAIAFWPGEKAANQADHLVVLDAATGELRAVHPDAWGDIAYYAQDLLYGVTKWHGLFALGQDIAVTWSEDGFRVTGWDLDTSKARWQHTLPESCVEAPSVLDYPRNAMPVMLRDVVAVAAFCGQDLDDKLRRGQLGPVELQVTVLGLDPQTGSEVWRHQRTAKIDLRFVHLLPSVDAQAVAVTWRGENQPKDYGMVLAQADGRVLTDDRAGLDGWDLRTAPFTGEGSLTLPDSEKSSDYRWEPFEAGEVRTASVSVVGLAREVPHPTADLPLARAVVTTRPDPSGAGVVVLLTPWDTGDTRRIPVNFASPGDPVSLLLAPGAVVVVSGGDTMVVGLT